MNLAILASLIAVAVAIGVWWFRHQAVANFRFMVATGIFHRNIEELYMTPVSTHGFDTIGDERWAKYEAVSYNQMVFKFWKPLRSFYRPEDIKEWLGE